MLNIHNFCILDGVLSPFLFARGLGMYWKFPELGWTTTGRPPGTWLVQDSGIWFWPAIICCGHPQSCISRAAWGATAMDSAAVSSLRAEPPK